MSNKNKVVYAIFPNRPAVENAVSALRTDGFRQTDVSVLFSDNAGSKQFAHDKGTKAPEGSAVGASTGLVLGGTLGWLAGIGALAIPAVGPLIAAGPIMGLLAGAGIGGTLGGLTGALVGMGIPEYKAKRFEGIIKEGGILLSVHCDDTQWVKRAEDILKAQGGHDISSSTEARADIPVDEHDHIVVSRAV